MGLMLISTVQNIGEMAIMYRELHSFMRSIFADMFPISCYWWFLYSCLSFRESLLVA